MIRTHTQQPGRSGRGGFTLVEMLVAVALILLMMTLFAQAFSIAASSISVQRGVAENDQRARSLVSRIKGDLEHRTYRQRSDAVTEFPHPSNALEALIGAGNRNALGIVPLHPDYFLGGQEGASVRFVDPDRERGYFYISENNIPDDSDDIVQFTVDMSQTDLTESDDTTPLTGRARRINAENPATGSRATWFPDPATGEPRPHNINQPIWDDLDGAVFNGSATPPTYRSYGPAETGTSASPYAEISYFLRNGNLYRRQLLIRDKDGQPELDGGGFMISGNYNDVDGSPPPENPNFSDFWNDFDFSAQYAPGGSQPRVYLAEAGSLDNTEGGLQKNYGDEIRYLSLGNPQSRFGFDSSRRFMSGSSGLIGFQGRPREHYDQSDPLTFFGRFMHAETSHFRFRYPGLAAGWPTSPYSALNINDGDGNGIADLFENGGPGPRQGEELLLPNCHGFDVEVWDEEVGRWVDIGYGDPNDDPTVVTLGDYHIRQTTDASEPWDPTPGTNNPGRFQAAQREMQHYGSLEPDLAATPPRVNRVYDTWHPGFDFTNPSSADPSNPADDVPPYRPLWSERDSFNSDTSGAAPYLDGQTPLLYDPLQDYAIGDRVFPRPDQVNPFHGHQSFFYVATDGLQPLDPSNMSTGTEEPRWPEVPGGTVQDNEILWRAVPNTIGLKGIRITVRFFDPTSGQIRQVTITHSFVEL